MTAPNLGSTRFGKVIFRVVAGIADGPDANVLPDALPVTGFGVLTPRIERIIDHGDGTSPAQLVLPRPVRVTMVNGNLTYRGDPWVWLIASEPGVWRWHAQFTYKIGTETLTDEFSFDLPDGDPEDPNYRPTNLATARVLTDPSTGAPTVVGPPGRSVVDVQLLPNGLLFVMSREGDIEVTIPSLGDLGQAAVDAAASATAAASSAGDAAASATTAASSAAGAAASATTAATQASDASGAAATATTKASEAAASATTASTQATAADASAVAAADAASTATIKATEASDSAAASASSASTASTAASTATTKATDAASSASSAADSASTATTKAAAAIDAAATADTRAATATTAASTATTASTTAVDAASTATTKAGEATSAATTASTAATAADTSASAAATSASTATTKAGEASSSASTAQDAASTATAKASEAASSAAAAAQSAIDAASVVLDGLPNATAATKGGIKLTGDLGGTADNPTVPGLADKATPAYVDAKIAALVGSAPGTLDTLKELADALGADPNFATTMATQLGQKADREHVHPMSEVTGLVAALETAGRGLDKVVATYSTGDFTSLDFSIPGNYRIRSGTEFVTSAPSTSTLWWNVLVVNAPDPAGANTTLFFATTTSTGSLYYRVKYGATWSSWMTVQAAISTMTVAEGRAGTATTARSVRADFLAQIIRAAVTGDPDTAVSDIGKAVAVAANPAAGRTALEAAAATHEHLLADVTGLVSALESKADLAGGRVPAGQLATGGTDGQVLAKVGTSTEWVDPPQGGGLPSVPDGPLAAASAVYKNAATAAKGGTGRLRIAVLGDSTCDAYAGGQPGAPTSWSQTWPLQLAERLRSRWGLQPGGRGWVGASTPLLPANYSYTVSTLTPAGYGLDQLNSQIGIPGALWLHNGHASNVSKVEWQFEPGVTSVDLVLAAYGDPLTVTTATRGVETITPSGDPIVVRVATPGSFLSITPAANGFGLLGMIEHRGDENAGVTMLNLAQASMSANDYVGWLTGAGFTLAPMLTACDPDVALVCLGSNDYDTGRTPAQLTASLQTIHASLTAAAPGVVVVFVIRDLENKVGSANTWADYAAAISAAATATGAQVVDLRATVPNTAVGAYLADGVHLTEAGNAQFADAVADYLALGGVDITTGLISDMSAVGRQIARAADADTVREIIGAGKGGDSGLDPYPAKRIMTYSNGGMGQTVAAALPAATQQGIRIPVKLFAPTLRWRLKLRNYNMTNTARVPLTCKGVILGTHASAGNFSGSAAQNVVAGDFTIPGNGNFWYSPWVTDPALQFQKGVEHLIGLGWTMPSEGMLTTVGQCWQWATAAAALDPATSGGAVPSGIPLDFQIEYEVATSTHDSAWLVVADSILEGVTGPQGTSASSIVPQPIHTSPPQRWAEAQNILVQNISFAGITANVLAQTTAFPEFWTRQDLVQSHIDGILISLGSNDMAGSTTPRTLAQFQADMTTIVQKIRSIVGYEAPLYLGTVMPRNAVNATQNTARLAYNDWIRTLPLGAAGFVDFDQVMKSGGTSTTALQPAYTNDTIHPSYEGQAVLAQKMASIPTIVTRRQRDEFERMTQAQYDALQVRDPNKLYLIRG